MDSVTTKSLVFNTVNRNNNSGNIQTDLANPVFYLANPLKNVCGYTITNFVTPNTFLTIDSRNNIVWFVESTSTGTIRKATIPSAVYTNSSFATALGTAMQAKSTGTITATCSATSYKTTITSSVAIQLVAASNNAYYEMGFINLSVSSPTYQTTTVSDSLYDLSGVKAINLGGSLMGNQLVNSNQNILATIPVNVSFAGIMSYTNSNIFIDTPVSDINYFSFFLTDERGRTLTVNNDFIVTILFNIEP
ncbi:hypothetical protein HDV06_001479 [Boothiomyces sp. JEL0866]|nr:hypothetical protein HDV06_001479 [Boothiomyces sp. JEL0866]